MEVKTGSLIWTERTSVATKYLASKYSNTADLSEHYTHITFLLNCRKIERLRVNITIHSCKTKRQNCVNAIATNTDDCNRKKNHISASVGLI